MRPFGCAEFILDFLAGNGPEGSTAINSARGAPQSDIHAEYKGALRRYWAEDLVAKEKERRISRGEPELTTVEENALLRQHLIRITMKQRSTRYQSFHTYFGTLKRLGWVEPTGEEQNSIFQESYDAASPRLYYRISAAGRAAPPENVKDPLQALYQYPAEKRSPSREPVGPLPISLAPRRKAPKAKPAAKPKAKPAKKAPRAKAPATPKQKAPAKKPAKPRRKAPAGKPEVVQVGDRFAMISGRIVPVGTEAEQEAAWKKAVEVLSQLKDLPEEDKENREE